MKNAFLSGLALLLVGQVGMAHASGFYVSGKVGDTMLRSSQNTLTTTTAAGALTNTVPELPLGNATKTGFSPSFAVGYEFSTEWQQPIRLELAYLSAGSIRQNNTESTTMSSSWTDGDKFVQSLPTTVSRQQKTRVSTAMLNGYYDYTTGTVLTPYIMGGVGMAFLKNTSSVSQSGAGLSFSSDDFGKSNARVAWSLGAGVAWALTPKLSLDAGYMFTNAGDVTTQGTASNGIISSVWTSHTRLQLHTMQLGLRYTF